MYLPALEYWDEYPHHPDNPHIRGYSLIYVNIILLFFALFTFSLRIFTRTFISRSLGWDDLALTLGVIFTIGLSVDVALANLEYYWLVNQDRLRDFTLTFMIGEDISGMFHTH
jgi:magnesium-transporting ATPase (P-type)